MVTKQWLRDAPAVTGPRQGIYPAMRRIARDALALGVGSTLPTNMRYLEEHGIVAGTMQRALAALETSGALVVTSRGHLGRVIDGLDVGAAWQASGLPPIRLLFPPSGPPEVDTLSTLISEQLTAHRLPHTVHHARGGIGRLRATQQGEHDFALVSRGVLTQALEPDEAEAVPVRIFGPGTYYAPETLVVVTRDTQDPSSVRTVAIDEESYDHVAFTRAEFPPQEGFRYVPCPFTKVPAMVLRGEVEAGIWHRTATFVPLELTGLSVRQLHRPAAVSAWEALSPAVIVACPIRSELASVLEILNLVDLASRQRAALTRGWEEG